MRAPHLLLPGVVLGFLCTGPVFAPPGQSKPPPWQIAKEKMEAAQKACQAMAQQYVEGKVTVEQVHLWSNRWMDAAKHVAHNRKEEIVAMEGHAERMRELEQAAKSRVEARQALPSDLPTAQYFRLDAELDVTQAKTRLR
jgi:hypothetical protein